MARVLGLGPRGREFESRIPEIKSDVGRFSWLERPDEIGKVRGLSSPMPTIK